MHQPRRRSHLEIVLILGALTAFGPLSIDMYLPALPVIGERILRPAVRVARAACLGSPAACLGSPAACLGSPAKGSAAVSVRFGAIVSYLR